MSKLTYKEITERCKQSSMEILPDLPTENTIESWEKYLIELENLDTYEMSFEEVGAWDWCIYTHYGFQILEVMHIQYVNDAECKWHDLTGGELNENDGPYELASHVAFHLLVDLMREELDTLIEDMVDLSDMAISNLI